MPSTQVVEHPLISHYLLRLRDRRTPAPCFRELLGQIGALLAYEATRDLDMIDAEIQTPFEMYQGKCIDRPLGIVPILRAGMGFANAIARMIPDAYMGHIGIFRDDRNLSPVAYYQKLPSRIADGPVLLVDPMLATGGSAAAAVKLLKSHACTDIRFICLIAAPEGVAKLNCEAPDVRIITAAIDRQLDQNGCIRPGLGDAGDRIFGTVE